MLALPLRLGAHWPAVQKPLISTSTRWFVFPYPRNVSLNGNSPRDHFDRNVSRIPANSTSITGKTNDFVSVSLPKDSPLFVSILNRVWKSVVQKGDTVIDATCGNGHDTLAMLKMVADESCKGSVYGLDVQEAALQKTSSLLEESVGPSEKELIKLFSKCHSKMDEVLPKDTSVRLVAFNLGYLPGGDKTIITQSETTLKALEVAKSIMVPGGLISIVVYVGHPGGWEELKTIRDFISKLSVEKWICYEFQTVDRSWSPILIFLFKKC
ncbi:uncharacterized protein LOC18767956 isoform X2 [Prunus persica]|uniref:uncharacterized protein LOC18767956 isoform X2 n=1 Tax=Prunus persica TaxID=3760 RepID=UPI0009AB780D|nr:uncharacterized protein LOC18767956 isoform X2 [Prunus persica]